jgi:hypothetical protein
VRLGRCELSENGLNTDSRPQIDAEKTRLFAGPEGLARHRFSDSCPAMRACRHKKGPHSIAVQPRVLVGDDLPLTGSDSLKG